MQGWIAGQIETLMCCIMDCNKQTTLITTQTTNGHSTVYVTVCVYVRQSVWLCRQIPDSDQKRLKSELVMVISFTNLRKAKGKCITLENCLLYQHVNNVNYSAVHTLSFHCFCVGSAGFESRAPDSWGHLKEPTNRTADCPSEVHDTLL